MSTEYRDESKMEALAVAAAKIADALDLVAEATAAFAEVWNTSEIAERLNEFLKQKRLSAEMDINRTDIDDAIEVWSLPDDPIRDELEAVQGESS